MKITLLCENMISEKLWDCGLAEWGFSAFIEKDGKKILFDFGTSDVYVKNAKALGIDLEQTDFVVISQIIMIILEESITIHLKQRKSL